MLFLLKNQNQVPHIEVQNVLFPCKILNVTPPECHTFSCYIPMVWREKVQEEARTYFHANCKVFSIKMTKLCLFTNILRPIHCPPPLMTKVLDWKLNYTPFFNLKHFCSLKTVDFRPFLLCGHFIMNFTFTKY